MIRFSCPTCKKVLSAPPERAGAKASCPQCGQRIQVPLPPVPRNKTVLGQLEIGTSKTVLGELFPIPVTPEKAPAAPPLINQFDFSEPDSRALPGPPPLPQTPESGWYLSDYQESAAGRGQPYQPNRGIAIMVVGIVSCFCYILCLLLFWPSVVICLVTGPIAWVMGSQDLKGIQKGYLSQEGKSFVLTGYICGIVSTLLAIITLLSCLMLVVWFMKMISGGNSSRWGPGW